MENFLSILKTESSKSLIAPSIFILILTIFIVIVASITNISLAQTSVGGGGGGVIFSPSGCWDFYTEESCLNESDEYNCIWHSAESKGQFGWCEKTAFKNCWQYGDNLSCIANNCSWETYGYCNRKNCWDFKDKASCEQANVTYGINCRWETMGTADTSDDYCYEVGCWIYNSNETCSAVGGCSWESSGGWCYEKGCWDYKTETSCNAQENCKWEGGSYCRYKSCWDFKTKEDCLNNTAQNLNCVWDDVYKYCYEIGCCNFNKTECENNTYTSQYGLTCKWNGEYCYKPSCYDYKTQSECESTNDTLNCYWDSDWGECHELGCWNFYSQDDCEDQTDNLNCRWKKTGWCSEYGCWMFDDNESVCINNSHNLDCVWQADEHCVGDSSLNCWNYTDKTNCINAGCEWKLGWCNEKGCWNYQTQSICENHAWLASITPITYDGVNYTSVYYLCLNQDGSINDIKITKNDTIIPCANGLMNFHLALTNSTDGNITAYNTLYVSEDYNVSNCSEFENFLLTKGINITCNYWKSDVWVANGIDKNYEWNGTDLNITTGYQDPPTLNHTVPHPDIDCMWKTDEIGGGWCEEPSCWSFNETTCENNNYNLTCVWDNQSKSCYTKGCWDFNYSECINLSIHPKLNCSWKWINNTTGYCYEPGCWDYKDNSSCVSHGCRWEESGGFCEENITGVADCWSFQSNATCSNYTECIWEVWGSCEDENACWKQNTKTDCEALSSTKRCVWNEEEGYCYEKGCWEYSNSTECIGAGCSWDSDNNYCYEEGCWKYNTKESCLDTNDTLNCNWEDHYYCHETGCWDYTNESACTNAGCVWQTSGLCEAINSSGIDCWKYWDKDSCIAANGCNWTENSWCEEKGCWNFISEEECENNTNLGCFWESEGGWCTEPSTLQCWKYNQTECETTYNSTCRWNGCSCVNRECWEFYDNESCLNASPELGCSWIEGASAGWCEELGCWNFWNQTACNAHASDMKCTWATFGWCEEKSCWMFETNESCLNESDSLDCIWESATNPEGGWCENEFGKWDVDCSQYWNNATACNLKDGCRWRTGHCNEPGCWMYNETTCENLTVHPNLKCIWHFNGVGGWCEELGCWSFWNESACNNESSNYNLTCQWHVDPWNPEGGWCEEIGCWQYTDNSSCVANNCTWHEDPSGFGGWCEKPGCWNYHTEEECTNSSKYDCLWRTESHCERARCWMWDSINGGNKSLCINKGAEYGLNCTWNENGGRCEEVYTGCDEYDNNREGCFNTGFCWWDEATQTCNNPIKIGGEKWFEELEGEKINPGCWIFDYESKYCNENYVDVCKWLNTTNRCVGISADVEIQCGNIKDSELCESIPVLSTCCVWKNNKCQADPESTKCYSNIEEPPEGAKFCGDYVAYTDENTCKKIAGEPWFMPCEWDGEHCVFRSEEKFKGEKKGCEAITNKKDCEFAGCEWKVDFYCEGTKAVPFGWCEEKTGVGAKSCDAACWACEYQPNGSNWPNSSAAKKACENSKLGYCEFVNDSNAPNGFGYCVVPEDIKYIGDCSSDCKACEKKKEPKSACESSPADCKWVEDTTGVTEIGGWCYPKSEKSCAEDCFRCYDEKSCVNYGGGSTGTCIWDSNNQICKPKKFDKEICFNGIDDDGDSKIDCEDSDCFSDPFCGSGMMSNCWQYVNKEDCISKGNESGCIWIKDPWTGKEWCGMEGENCFLWDGDEIGCNNQPMCKWFPDPKGGFCEINDSKVKACFKATTQGACVLNPDCYWEIDPTSATGGICKPKIFKCEEFTTESECEYGEWINRCKWVIDADTGEGKCEPICESKDLQTSIACANNPNCQWMTGLCDPAELGMKMEECWKYDNDPEACENATGCEYHIEIGGGFCDINFTLNDEVCFNLTNQGPEACNNNTYCSWKGDPNNGWCDLKIFSCGWYQNESDCNTDPNHYGGCYWVWGGWCECTQPDCQGMCQAEYNQTECAKYSQYGCEWRGPHCEPMCFNKSNMSSCNAEKVCAWREGFCEPKMIKTMFKGMEEAPVELGFDECGPGSKDENIAKELDICGFGMREMPDNYGFGASVESLENAALCKGKKIVKQGPIGLQEITDSGTGTNPIKFYLYLDTDGNKTGNCWLWDDPDQEGYEFFFKYEVKLEDGEVKETRTAYRCKDNDWVVADIKLTGWRTLMCSETGGLMIAVNKDDLEKFTNLFVPGEEMRIYVATAGKKGTESSPSDTAGPGFYTPGAIDFKFEDCLTPGVDMDGDGFVSENDPDCFIFYKSGGFIKHEDCFETGVDEDEDGLVDCDDPDCKFAPNCIGKSQMANDTTAPSLTWYKVFKYPDAAFIKYDTNEPANGTIQFYYNDSTCEIINKTILDPALLDSKTKNDYKNWHDGPIDNFNFNPQKLGYNLTNGTTYYYKIKICDSSGNCAVSACLNFTTAASESKKDCPDCYAIIPGEKGACGVARKKIDYKNITDIPLLAENETAVIIEDVRGSSFDEPNVTMDTAKTSDGKSAGYVGMNSEDYDRIISKIGAYTDINCTIKVPKGGGNCEKLWHCPDPVDGVIDISKCEDRTDEAVLISSAGDYCVWKVPCDFSVWMSNPGTAEGEKGDGGGGGGGGAGGVPGVAKAKNATKKLSLVPGVGLRNNTKLQAALEKVLGIGKMSEQAIENLLRLSASIVADLEATRNFKVEQNKSKLELKIKYKGKKKAKNFIVYDSVPKTFANSSDLITVTAPKATVEIVEKDPEYAFVYPEVSEGEELTITYEVDGEKDASLINETSAEFYAESFEEKIIEEKICTEGEKRCLNNNLQECRNNKWQTIEICEYGCNSTSLTCNPAPVTAEKPEEIKKKDYSWIYVAIIAIIILAGLGYYFLVYKKK